MSTESEKPPLLGGREAAALVGVSVPTWRRWADGGIAPYGVKVGGLRRWNRLELERWLAAGCPRQRPTKTTRTRHEKAPAQA